MNNKRLRLIFIIRFKEKDFITGFGTENKFALLADENGKYKNYETSKKIITPYDLYKEEYDRRFAKERDPIYKEVLEALAI